MSPNHALHHPLLFENLLAKCAYLLSMHTTCVLLPYSFCLHPSDSPQSRAPVVTFGRRWFLSWAEEPQTKLFLRAGEGVYGANVILKNKQGDQSKENKEVNHWMAVLVASTPWLQRGDWLAFLSVITPS